MMRVRLASGDDAPAMNALETECFSSPWSVDAFLETMQDKGALFFVCESDGCVLGYAGGICVLDECSITNVAVSAAFRRCGAATALLDALEREAAQRGAVQVFLEVRASNEPAICAYEGRGYERVGVRRGFYRLPTEDAYVYKKQLL